MESRYILWHEALAAVVAAGCIGTSPFLLSRFSPLSTTMVTQITSNTVQQYGFSNRDPQTWKQIPNRGSPTHIRSTYVRHRNAIFQPSIERYPPTPARRNATTSIRTLSSRRTRNLTKIQVPRTYLHHPRIACRTPLQFCLIQRSFVHHVKKQNHVFQRQELRGVFDRREKRGSC